MLTINFIYSTRAMTVLLSSSSSYVVFHLCSQHCLPPLPPPPSLITR